jgi:hypothetical protein
METAVRKLLTFLIALAAIAFGVCSPALAGSMMLTGLDRLLRLAAAAEVRRPQRS